MRTSDGRDGDCCAPFNAERELRKLVMEMLTPVLQALTVEELAALRRKLAELVADRQPGSGSDSAARRAEHLRLVPAATVARKRRERTGA